MIVLKLQTKLFEKTYLGKTERYAFDSLLDLVFDLFSNYQIASTDWDELIYGLLKDLGYPRIQDIPRAEIADLAHYYYHSKDREDFTYDSEKAAFLVLAAVQKGRLIPFVDDQIIEDLQAPILLRANSVLAFIDNEKINSITFKTI